MLIDTGAHRESVMPDECAAGDCRHPHCVAARGRLAEMREELAEIDSGEAFTAELGVLAAEGAGVAPGVYHVSETDEVTRA